MNKKTAGTGWLGLIVASSMALGSQSAFAKAHPYSAALVSQAQSAFFQNGIVSPTKVDAYIAKLKQKREELRSLHVGDQARKGNRDPKKVAKKIDDEKALLALDVAIANLETMKSSKDEGVIYEMAANALDIESSLRIEGDIWNIEEQVRQTINSFRSWTIPNSSPAADEASNLYDPVKKEYLSVADIEKLKADGADLSLYGPGPVSPFWENPGDVRRVDLAKASRGQTLKLYENIVEFPQDSVFHFDEVKHSDTKPKMDVYTVDAKGKKKSKFKLKWGAEIHADPTVAALTMALGFKSDVTKYARDIRVYIGKTRLSEIKREWDVYYSRDAIRGVYNFERYVKQIGKDKAGDYIVFKEGLIEAKPDEIDRLGGWGFSELGHTDHREVRGLSMVQVWLRNSDIKEFNNNRLLLKKNADGTTSRHLIISDLGASLGNVFHEMPDLLSWKMVSSKSEKEVVLNYKTFHVSGIRNVMTRDDARWGARLIGSLSREQIAAAVDHGNWPQCMRPILVEKLVVRRNDILQGLDLIGARQLDGSLLQLLPATGPQASFDIDKLCDTKQVAQEFTSEFELDTARIIQIVARQAQHISAGLARSGVNKMRRFQLSGPQLGLDKRAIVDVIFDVDRVIERNPDPKTEQDVYLLKDRFEIGYRLGANFGIYKDFIYTRAFTLVYPVRSVREAELNNGFIVNALLPAQLRMGNVPENYVLMTEHYFESGTGIQIENLDAFISPVFIAGGSRVRLLRSIFDHRDPAHYTLYRDRSDFVQGKLEALVRLYILKIPVFKALNTWGTATGRGSVFTAEELAAKEGSDSVLAAMVDGDFRKIEPRERQFALTNSFSNKVRDWKFLFWSGQRTKDLEQIVLTSPDVQRDGIQFKTMRESDRNVLGNREQKSVSVETYTDVSKPGQYQLNVRVMSFDTATDEKHLDGRYLSFINGLSVTGKKVINLTPSLGYTTNKMWGATVTTSDTHYSEKAVANILAMTPTDFWTALASSIGVQLGRIDEMKKGYKQFKAARSSKSVAPLESFGLTRDDAEMLVESDRFLSRLSKAKTEKKLEKRVEAISEAVRSAVFVGSSGFYSPRILGALNRIAGQDTFFSKNLITVPPFKEMNLLEEIPMYGEIGTPLKSGMSYLVFKPVTAFDLYTIFDGWF
ncbi:MAG: hypothetical protein V4760_17835 [Bdellovibrionota bacterium]